MQDINLYHLLKFYKKKWFWIVLFSAIGALSGYIYTTYIQVPLYKSDATLLLVSTEDRKIGQDSTLINNYIELLKSRRVLEPAINKQQYDISYNDLAGSTTASNEKDTEVIKLSISSTAPEMSKDLVDGVVVSFRDEIKKLYNTDNISIVDNASLENKPYNMHPVLFITSTTAAGFLASITLLFFAYDLKIAKKNASVKSIEKIKTKKAPRQGGLVNKIIAMLVGAEAEQSDAAVEQRHRSVIIIPPSEKESAKLVKNNTRQK